MKLLALPAFSDNYLWLLHDTRQAIVVDPGQAAPILECLQVHRLALQTILVTHHHPDHVGGVAQLREATGACVVGPANERIPEPFEPLRQDDIVNALGLRFSVIDVPGHTAGHIAYYAKCPDAAPLLFCGDTLFSGGCGRLFEGTPAQMLDSLDRLAVLPGDTRVCCAHEYTLGNLKFALEVDPDNAQLVAYTTTCRTRREQGQPTLPSTIDTERQINPFLRSNHPSIQTSVRRFDAQGAQQQGIFATLRQWKNQYR